MKSFAGPFFLILGTIALIFALVWFDSSQKQNPQIGKVEFNKNGHVLGNLDSKVQLVEFGDYQCPACGFAHPLVKQLMGEFSDRIAFEFRHFPLRSIHPYGQIASQAVEAAGKQGKYWEMHNALLERQSDWAGPDAQDKFNDYAKELELNVEQFKTDIFAQDVIEKVNNDALNGSEVGVSSTPTFILNGTKISNPGSYAEFRDLILKELEKVNESN